MLQAKGGKSEQICMEPNFSIMDDKIVRFWARKSTTKNLEILKACKVVVEMFENLKGRKPRNSGIDNWDENFERKFVVWKIVHGRFLNLKETEQPNPTKENGLKDFCLSKGLLRKKENWEEVLVKSL